MSRERIERALKRATDTKACVIGEDVLPRVVPLFREWFPGSARATVVCDPRTRAAAGERVAALLREAGIEVAEHVLEPGGATFHADYRYAAEVRDAIAAAGGPRPVPVAVGSGVVNDLVKRASGELTRASARRCAAPRAPRSPTPARPRASSSPTSASCAPRRRR